MIAVYGCCRTNFTITNFLLHRFIPFLGRFIEENHGAKIMSGKKGRKCSMKFCDNYQHTHKHLSFFRFPKDPER